MTSLKNWYKGQRAQFAVEGIYSAADTHGPTNSVFTPSKVRLILERWVERGLLIRAQSLVLKSRLGYCQRFRPAGFHQPPVLFICLSWNQADFIFLSTRWRPKQKHKSSRDWSLWSLSGGRECLWKHTSRCHQDKDAGTLNGGCTWAGVVFTVCLNLTDKIKPWCFFFNFKGLEAHKYKNTLDCALKILRHEGLAAWVDLLQF